MVDVAIAQSQFQFRVFCEIARVKCLRILHSHSALTWLSFSSWSIRESMSLPDAEDRSGFGL